jgi:uncharacterized membrane protein YhiD involved in acid resistance
MDINMTHIMTELWYLAHVGLAAVLSGIIGIERESAEQDAGFRTIMLVGMGSAVFTVLSQFGFGTDVGDPSRIASQIVVGIGFLGAGALIRTGARVKNLTTAATIWVAAALGMACGVGWFVFAIGITVLTILTLVVLRKVEHHAPFSPKTPQEDADSADEDEDDHHPQPNLGTSPRMGWLEDAPEKNYKAEEGAKGGARKSTPNS